MATTIATAYVQIMPSFKGAKAAIESELSGAVSAPLEKEVATAAPRVGAKLGSDIAAGVSTGVKTGLGTTLSNNGPILGGVKSVSSAITTGIGGATASASTTTKALGRDLESLVGKTTSLSAVRNAATGAVGSLGGIASLVGYGGPLGIALAAGALAFSGFQKAQENAAAAAQTLLATLNKETGALTASSLDPIIEKIAADLDKPGDLGLLKSMNITLADSVVALSKGSAGVDAYIAKLEQAKQSVKGSTHADVEKIAAINGLESSLRNQLKDISDSNNLWTINKDKQDASAQAAKALGLNIDYLTTKSVDYLSNLSNASASQSIFKAALDSISASAQKVTDRINAVPTKVTITAKSVGLDKLIADLDTIIGRYVAMATAISNVNQIAVDGERHGADVGATSTANTLASQGLAAVAAAEASTTAALNAHNAAAAVARTKAGGGSALANARTRLLDDISGSFLTDLVAASPSQIKSTIDKLITGVRAALSGHSETSLVAFLRKDNTSLDSLAKRRDDIVQRISDAQATFTQAKASATPDLLTIPHSGPGLANALAKQLDTLRRFHANLVLLSKRGLPKVFLQQLVNAGLDGAQAAMDLASGSAGDFTKIRSLSNALDAESSKYATDATNALYGVGVNTGKGLIAGLQSQESAIEAQMSKIGAGMVKAIKRSLGIKSPSSVFRDEVGLQIAAGVVQGLEQGRPGLDKAVAGMVRPSGARLSLVGAGSGARGPAIEHLHLHNTTDGTVMGGINHALRVADWMVPA